MSVRVPPAPGRDRRKRRHSTRTMQVARSMYGDGDSWTVGQIADYLRSRGIDVSATTVRCWCVPDYAERQRAYNRNSWLRRTGRPPSATPVLDRMNELRAAGVTFPAIASVIALDQGIEMKTDQVRYYVRNQKEPRLPKRRVGLAA